MNEALVGVVVGGLIAWIAPLLTLRYTEKRWKFERRLDYLKAERDRFELLYEKNLEKFGEGITNNSYSSEMAAEILALMPAELGDLYSTWMSEKDKNELKCKHMYLQMASAMKRDLARRDQEIKELFENGG